MQTTSPDLYMNMSQFSELKLAARQHSAEAGKAAAQQFEGLFVQMMLKSMRSAAVMDPSQHSSNMDFYSDMYDKQMSLMLSQAGGIGIADVIEKQLDRFMPEGQETAAADGKTLPTYRLPTIHSHQLPLAVMDYVSTNPAVNTFGLNESVEEASVGYENKLSSLQSQTLQPFYGWPDAKSFVNELWPHAEKAASRLGVSAHVLVAQSALETGWGRFAMKKPDGSVAFNLFGIKSSHGWAGQNVMQQTLEFRQGAMQQETARFRAYDSVADALDDYVDFVQSSPRYQYALQHNGSDVSYIKHLHKAGYATDPAYADKIINIMSGQTFNDAIATLADSQPRHQMVG